LGFVEAMNFINEQNGGLAQLPPGFIYGGPNVLDSGSDSGKVYKMSTAVLGDNPVVPIKLGIASCHA